MKIVMLAGNSDSTLYMYNGLKKHFNIDKVIIEERPDKVAFIKRRINKIGILKVLGQIVFIIYSKLLFKISRNKIEKLKTILNLDEKEMDDEIVEKVQSVNTRETKLLLVKLNPDIVIINGTRIISKDILNSIDGIFVNTHLGITPKYRGVHGGYWALANDDKENCGTTIHIVNSGIDTGDILYQRTIEVTKMDNYCTYR